MESEPRNLYEIRNAKLCPECETKSCFKSDVVNINCFHNKAFEFAQKNYTRIIHSSDTRDFFVELDIIKKDGKEYEEMRTLVEYDIVEDPYLNNFFEKLKTTIPSERLNQIHRLKDFYRCVLIEGGNKSLKEIEAVVSYIYYHHIKSLSGKKNYFHCVDCFGYTEEKLGVVILGENATTRENWNNYDGETSLINHYLSGNTLFLRDVENVTMLKRLVGIVRNNTDRNYGVLIISVPSIDGLPEEIIQQSNIIYLKTRIQLNDEAMTITINGKEFIDIPDREYKLFKLLYNNKDICVSHENIQKELEMDVTDQMYILVTNLRNLFKEYPITFYNLKKTKNSEGKYRLIIKY